MEEEKKHYVVMVAKSVTGFGVTCYLPKYYSSDLKKVQNYLDNTRRDMREAFHVEVEELK